LTGALSTVSAIVSNVTGNSRQKKIQEMAPLLKGECDQDDILQHKVSFFILMLMNDPL